MDRFMSILDQTQQDPSVLPPISVQEGSDGTPISDVTFDPTGEQQ